MSENVQEIDRNQLFLQALQERMAQMVVEYEQKVAELRVEFTVLTAERDGLLKAIDDRESQNKAATDAVPDQDPQAR